MSTAVDNIAGKGRNLSTNFWIWALILSLLVFAGNTIWATTKSARLGGASTAASDLQVNSQRLANQGREAVGGKADSFAAFKATKDQIDSDIKLLNDRYGNAAGVAGPIKTVTATWAPLAKSAEQVTASQQAVLGLAGNADRFTQQVPQLQAQMDEVVRAMSASGSPSSQIYIALREVVLAATMARRVAEIRAGGPGASLAGDALSRDSGVFAQVLAGLRQGDATLNVQKLGNGSAIAALNQATATWTDMKKDLDALLGSSSNLFRAQAAEYFSQLMERRRQRGMPEFPMPGRR